MNAKHEHKQSHRKHSPAPARSDKKRSEKQTRHAKASAQAKTGKKPTSKARNSKHAQGPKSQLCPVAAECGACSAIHVPYPEQLANKQKRIVDLFSDLADESCMLDPIAGMKEPLHYRNKITSPFAPGRVQKGGRGGQERRHEVLCGMYAAHSHRIIPADTCAVENEIGRKVVAAIKAIMGKYGIEPYNEDSGAGFMRHAIVRVGHESGEVLVTLVTNSKQFPGAKNFARELKRRCPAITTIVQNVNLRQTNVILGQEEHTIYGPGFIIDTLCGLSFRISSHSFYQVNSKQTEVLYRTAVQFAGLADDNAEGSRNDSITVLDAYCGTGTIGLIAAAASGRAQVIGVDSVDSAIRDARANAAHNGIKNAEFVTADAGTFMKQCAAQNRTVDVLMMDPPRAGASEDFLDAVNVLSPGRIVYISCNPTTQARDVEYLRTFGYRPMRIRPVDMFPHTDHVENVVLLEREAKLS